MSSIDPTARVEDGAVIDDDASIGPYCMVGQHVRIGAGCRLIGHVHVTGRTTVGANTTIYPFASLGTAPQSLAHRGELTRLEIGEGCTIREGVTMSAGTVGGGGITRVGDGGYFMNNAHIGHDCIVGKDVIFATSATLGGHCEIGDNVFIGGLSAVHQHTRVGHQVMIAGVSGVRADIIPFAVAIGQIACLDGLNIIGMRRRRFTRERLKKIRSFYQVLFHGSGIFADRLQALKDQAADDPAIAEILAFIEQGKHRALCFPRNSFVQESRGMQLIDSGLGNSPSKIGVIAGGGVLPFAVADAILASGRKPHIFAIKGSCDAEHLKRFSHDWISLGQFGRIRRLLRAEGCRDLIFVGSLVRPALSEIRFDLRTLFVAPKIYASFRGGDDHLLTGVAGIFEESGYRVVGVKDIVPNLVMPSGNLTRSGPDNATVADIDKGLSLLRALGPFDVGQAVVVIDRNVVAVEDIEGTDGLLARVAQLREKGRLRSKPGLGVLVKAPKVGQDLRFDLPTLGPRTVEGAAAAGLSGIAIVADHTLIAEPQLVVATADKAGLFVTGLRG